MIRWEHAPGPYEVVFSTREGGVSEGPFASLNLGRATADEPERVDENRRRLCAEVGAQLEGIASTGVQALGGGLVSAIVGPGIGPCCYEVGEDVAAPFRRAFGLDVVRDGKLDLWSAAERALRAAGCARVDRVDLCTACTPERFFSHRRDEGITGRQGVLGVIG